MPQQYLLMQVPGATQAEGWIKLGVESQMSGKLPEAERYYREALKLEPRNHIATQNLACLFAQTNNLPEALLTIERASLFDGSTGTIYANRALMCLEAERLDEALAIAEKGVSVCASVETRLAMAAVATSAANPKKALDMFDAILTEQPQHPTAGMNFCFTSTLADSTTEELLAPRKRWYEANRFKGPKQPHTNDFHTGQPLRVGYVSGDYKSHSAAMIFGAVVLHHDKSKVIPFLYSTLPLNPSADPASKGFMEAAGNNWRDITALNDEAADELIRNDQIDILVDLSSHTQGSRLALFTRKPAPIQITAWGFAHGTGIPEIDYFFADPIAVPESERKFYAEKVIDLPCVVTYNPPTFPVATSKMPYFGNDYITFGSFCRYEKLSDGCLATFARILEALPGSKLLFKDHLFRRPYSIKRVMEAMPKIEPSRLLFAISTSHQDHLMSYQQADVILDPFPHGGGVVGLEQLYAGIPIVTLYGKQPSGRTTSSVLTAIGRVEWIAKTTDEYVSIAVKMANDIPALSKARKSLRDEFINSKVIVGYREAVESAYHKIWASKCELNS